jgi:hypothetical protein
VYLARSRALRSGGERPLGEWRFEAELLWYDVRRNGSSGSLEGGEAILPTWKVCRVGGG